MSDDFNHRGHVFRATGFLKPFLLGNILQSENEGGVNLILITILRF